MCVSAHVYVTFEFWEMGVWIAFGTIYQKRVNGSEKC
jgi:hypothetical protein